MKVYAGARAAARHYVETGRRRVDDYYLTEGPSVARRFTAAGGRVEELPPLTGNGYEAWVAGMDPSTGVPRGHLRDDDRAVRFVEVVVNGPKSWSLAAAPHGDIAAAYDAAQDRAAGQIIGWLAEHAATRVGPRGAQVQVPLEMLEAVTVRHHTSRAGDPHRHLHLHLQINARVFAAGKWRGLHTVGVRDSLAAINGIGHAAVVADPQFRATLAAHGFTFDASGEIAQLDSFVCAFSARAAQIARNVDRYEAQWTAGHPGQRAGPALRRSWDARAWADGRPDKLTASYRRLHCRAPQPRPGRGAKVSTAATAQFPTADGDRILGLRFTDPASAGRPSDLAMVGAARRLDDARGPGPHFVAVVIIGRGLSSGPYLSPEPSCTTSRFRCATTVGDEGDSGGATVAALYCATATLPAQTLGSFRVLGGRAVGNP